jgi:hypothetical protein
MQLFMSWARSTMANVERSLSRTEHQFDRILVGVLLVLAIVIALLFTQGA